MLATPSDAPPVTASDPATPRNRRLGLAAIAILAYLPPLQTDPGKVAADTKSYLYIDPARMLGRAAAMWDPNIGFGTVTHQNIGYLFPMGPWYYTFDRLGVPDWVAQRLWLGSLVAAAGFGVLYLARSLSMRGPGVPVAVLAYMFSPYSLHYAARISVLLGPWAALPWMIGLTVYALRDGGWRYPALFALVVQLVGGVNATALIFAGIGPVAWILWQWLGTREIDARRALGVAARIGALSVVTSLWWISGLSLQGGYGLDILNFTETIKAVARTSTPNEVLRGLGYWFFYGRDRLGPWIEAAANYTRRPRVIFTGYSLSAVSLLAATLVRWKHRGYFVLLTLIGVVIAVGAYPYDHPTPLGALFKAFANSSSAGLALRSTGRAIPLVVLGLAMSLSGGVTAAVGWLHANVRFSRYALAPALLAGAAVLSAFPAIYNGTYYGKNLERPEALPKPWQQVAKYLDGKPNTTRVLALPGADFASYRWGNTVDPILPGMMDRPYVARELIPYGSAPSADLLNALDRRIQEGVLDPTGLVDVLRRAGIGEVVLRNDIEWERYNLIRPRELEQLLAKVPGLSVETAFGPVVSSSDSLGIVDERTLNPQELATKEPREIVVLRVPNQTPIVRAETTDAPVVVAGDGEGFIDAADAGVLAGNGVVLSAATYANDPARLRKLAGPHATLVLTDENRKRGRRWSTVLDNLGYTEQAGETPLTKDVSDNRLDVFPGAGDRSYTVVEQQGVRSVQATAYGNPISFTPEDRPARAFDGDLNTGWSVGAFDRVVGQRIELETLHPITTDHIGVVQVLHGPRDRYITSVRLRFDNGPSVDLALDPSSREVAGQSLRFPTRTFSKVSIEITGTNRSNGPLFSGMSAVGFEEIRVADDRDERPIRVHEVTRLPEDLLQDFGRASLTHPLVVTFTRLRVREVPPRSDVEPNLTRTFTLPTDRSFALTGDVRVFPYATQPRNIDKVLGAQGSLRAFAHQFLPGCLACRGASAVDGDPNTAWTTPLNAALNQWLAVERSTPFTIDHLDLSIVADRDHALPTKLAIAVDGTTHVVNLPTIHRGAALGNLAKVHVSFPAMTGRHFKLTILGVETRCNGDQSRTPLGCSHSYYAGDALLALPVAIAELGVADFEVPALPTMLPSQCRTDLLRVDGAPVAARVVGRTADAIAGDPMRVELCTTTGNAPSSLFLRAGRHEIETTPGSDTALSIDRMVLSSAAGGAAAPVAAAIPSAPAVATAPAVSVSRGRIEFTAKVTGANKPFWFVLGQSYNAGWHVKVGGRDLGPSTLVDGFANGWLIDPKGHTSLVVSVAWEPQTRVWVALGLSGVACIACIGVAFATRRKARAMSRVTTWLDTKFVTTNGTTPARARVAAATAIAGSVAALIVGPWVGVGVAVAVALAMRLRWARRALVWSGPFLLFMCGLYVVQGQWRNNYPAVFEWPTLFARLNTIGWLAIVLTAASAFVDRAAAPPGTPHPAVGPIDVPGDVPGDVPVEAGSSGGDGGRR